MVRTATVSLILLADNYSEDFDKRFSIKFLISFLSRR